MWFKNQIFSFEPDIVFVFVAIGILDLDTRSKTNIIDTVPLIIKCWLMGVGWLVGLVKVNS